METLRSGETINGPGASLLPGSLVPAGFAAAQDTAMDGGIPGEVVVSGVKLDF